MKAVQTKLEIKLSKAQLYLFVENLKISSRKNYGSTEIIVSSGYIDLRRVSPVPRRQITRIHFREEGSFVTIYGAEMISLDGSKIFGAAELLKSDLEDLIHFFVYDFISY